MNWWIVLACAVVYMLIGCIWYAPPVFGKIWSKGVFGDAPKACAGSKMGIILGVNFVLCIASAFIMAQVVEYVGAISVLEGVLTGFWMWLGFSFTVMAANALYTSKKFSILAIESLYHLLSFMVMGVILALWL